jgi:hypothetical protein
MAKLTKIVQELEAFIIKEMLRLPPRRREISVPGVGRVELIEEVVDGQTKHTLNFTKFKNS